MAASAVSACLPPEVFSAALRGWKLLPIKAHAKTPLEREWQKTATNDHDDLWEWAAKYPGCNWAMATGPGSGVFVLDIDGDPGSSALRAYREQGRDIQDTLSVSTGRGIHLYLQWPKGECIRNSAGRLASGLDIRGEGGYVIIPPSVHPSGAKYAFIDPNQSIKNAPEWLLESLRQPIPTSPITAHEGSIIGPGRRTPLLFSIAGKLRGEGSRAMEFSPR